MKAKTKNAKHALSQSFMNNSFGKKFHICAFRSHFWVLCADGPGGAQSPTAEEPPAPPESSDGKEGS